MHVIDQDCSFKFIVSLFLKVDWLLNSLIREREHKSERYNRIS